MTRRSPSSGELRVLWARLSYQFTPKVANALLNGKVEVEYGSRRRIRYVYLDGSLVLTLRPGDGLFSITMKAGEIIRKVEAPPRFRVIVRDGELKGSVFAKDVVGIDPQLRPGDEAIVVTEVDELVGVGRLRLPSYMLKGLQRGEIVRLK